MTILDNGVYREMTAEESAQLSAPSVADMIADLKQKLYDTDYQAIKHAEGFISETDYTSIKQQRQTWRDEINTLQGGE